MSRPDPDLSAVLRRLGSVPVSRHDLPAVLGEFVESAAAVLGARPEASVTLVRGGPGRTVASTGPLALRLDEVQYGGDTGPCLESARGGRPTAVLAPDGSRWPGVAAALRDAGLDGVWSHPLPVDGPVAGSLNLYVRGDHAGAAPEVAAALVATAVVPVTNAWLYEEAVRTADNLRLAMETRAVIEQAKGILMERLRITADQAFEALARTSNDTNTKLRDVAQAIVDTGRFPRWTAGRGHEATRHATEPGPSEEGPGSVR